MRMAIVWISLHRNYFIAVLGLSFWVAANYWYFRRDIYHFRQQRKPHHWAVDMAAKTSRGGKNAPK